MGARRGKRIFKVRIRQMRAGTIRLSINGFALSKCDLG
jgi:hypothetical protein